MLVRGHKLEAGIIVWLIVTVVAILVNAVFDPTLEGPQVAWWLWAMLGFGISLVALDQAGRLPAMSLLDRPEPQIQQQSGTTVGTGTLG